MAQVPMLHSAYRAALIVGRFAQNPQSRHRRGLFPGWSARETWAATVFVVPLLPLRAELPLSACAPDRPPGDGMVWDSESRYVCHGFADTPAWRPAPLFV